MGRLSTPTWLQTIWDGSDRKTYLAADRRCVAMPLGGIGTGHLCICGDGSLRQWQITNNIHHIAYVPFGFFALRVDEGWSKQRACILQTGDFWDQSSFQPAPGVSDHVVPIDHVRAFAGYPLAGGTRFSGEYPVARVAFELDDMPVDCVLTAWSPLVPFDPELSGMPVAVFEFDVKNRSDRALFVSLLGSLQNLVGWDGTSPIRNVSNQGYGGNANRLRPVASNPAIQMLNLNIPSDHPHYGEVLLSCDGREVSSRAQWSDLGALWQDFASDGKLESPHTDRPSPRMSTWNGALCEARRIEPGATERVTFLYAWRFPNRYVDFAQSASVVPRDKSLFYLGNEYAKRFPTASDAAESFWSNNEYLRSQTMEYRDAVYDSTLPYHLIDAVTANSSTLRTSICMRTEDGHFFGFEGGCGASAGGVFAAGGCCPMNCTHVWNYDQTLFHLFPGLHAEMRQVDWMKNQHESGYLPHRVILPLYLPRLWGVGIGGPSNPAADGLFAGILKTYQQWRSFPDESRPWDELLTHVKAAIEYAMEVYDDEGDGMIRGEQPNTYDIHLYGANTFIGSMYLACLLACEKMLPDLEAECRRRFESGSKLYDDACWNGEYYRQIVEKDRFEHQFGDGCAADQLLGQWWAHICGLGYVFPKERVRAALQAIFDRNFRDNFEGFEQRPRKYALDNERGLLNATYEPAQRPNVPLLYSDEVWSGVEYAFASLMMYEGMTEQAMQVVKAARDRYSGSHRNPFNEIECGDHYVRPMSVYSLFLAATGVQYDAREGSLSFAPRWPGDDLRAFFIAGASYGIVSVSTKDGKLHVGIQVRSGEIAISELKLSLDEDSLGGWRWNELRASFGDAMLDVEMSENGCVLRGFTAPIRDDSVTIESV